MAFGNPKRGSFDGSFNGWGVTSGLYAKENPLPIFIFWNYSYLADSYCRFFLLRHSYISQFILYFFFVLPGQSAEMKHVGASSPRPCSFGQPCPTARQTSVPFLLLRNIVCGTLSFWTTLTTTAWLTKTNLFQSPLALSPTKTTFLQDQVQRQLLWLNISCNLLIHF